MAQPTDSNHSTQPGGGAGAPPSLASISEHLQRARGRLSHLIAQTDRLVRINKALRAYLPPNLQDHTTVAAMSAQNWVVQTDSSARATRLRYLLPQLQADLEKHLGIAVPTLTLRIQPPATPPPAAPTRRLTLTSESARLLEGAAQNLSDARLGAALLRLAERAQRRAR